MKPGDIDESPTLTPSQWNNSNFTCTPPEVDVLTSRYEKIESDADLLKKLELGICDEEPKLIAEEKIETHVFFSKRFNDHELFLSVLNENAIIDSQNTTRKITEIIQSSLYSLGYDIGEHWVDGKFGESTTIAIGQFQSDQNLPVTGYIDTKTLQALDEQSFDLTSLLTACETHNPDHSSEYKFVVTTRNKTILYVFNKDDTPIARYKVSPGAWGHRTPSGKGQIQKTYVRSWWYPPNSPWAAGERPQPPGVNNAMGLVKHKLFGAIYVHGTPKKNEYRLGRPASHGCIRMSPTNILDVSEKYISTGTQFELTRNPSRARDLEALFDDHEIAIADLDQGRLFYASYLTKELGD